MSNYESGDAYLHSPGLKAVRVKATPSPLPPPFIPQQITLPSPENLSPHSLKKWKKPNRRNNRPSQGDTVLINFMDPNQPDIARLVGERALNSDSGSKADDEEMEGRESEPATSDSTLQAGPNLASLDLVGTAQAESSFSAIVRTRSDVLPSVSQRQLQRKRTSEVDVGFALARDEHKKKNRRIDLTGLARVLGNRSYEDDRVLLNLGKRSKNDDLQKHSSASLIENEVKLQSPRVLLDSIRTDILASKVAQAESQNGDTYTTSHISNAAKSAQAVAERVSSQIVTQKDVTSAFPTDYRDFHDSAAHDVYASLPSPPLFIPKLLTESELLCSLLDDQRRKEHQRQEEDRRLTVKLMVEDRHLAEKLAAEGRHLAEKLAAEEVRQLKIERDRFDERTKQRAENHIAEAEKARTEVRQDLDSIPIQQIPSWGGSHHISITTKSFRQHLLSGTYETGAVGVSKETESALYINNTISGDMSKGEQARNKARLSAITDRPRILGSKRLSILGFAHGRTSVEAHRNYGTLLLKDRSSFSVSSREDLQKKALSDNRNPASDMHFTYYA